MKAKKILLFCALIIFATSSCKKKSGIISKLDDNNIEYNDLFEKIELPTVDNLDTDWDKVTYLEKVGEISEGFSDEEENFFANITDLCIDQENNLYVADSGLRMIFKFDPNGEFIHSFGQSGQGPGEFLGRLRINIGNDNNLYITDDRNNRLLTFTKTGKFINQFNLPRNRYEDVVVNSYGDIFLLSESGIKIIELYNSNLKFKRALLDMSYCLDFPYIAPPRLTLFRISMKPSIMEIHKLLTKDNHLIVVFNNSQIITCFDENLELINQFRVKHPRFINDYKKRINDARKKDGWINCFGSVFLNEMKFLNLCYFYSDLHQPEIYRYQLDGQFIDTLRFKDPAEISNHIVYEKDNNGRYYGTNQSASKIIIYMEEDVNSSKN